MEEAVIVTGLRTPIGKAHTGSLKDTRPDELAALVVRRVLEATPGLDKAEVDDVVLGCAMPEGEQGLNVARVAALRSGLPARVPGFTVNRFCSSGLQAIAIAAERIMVGAASVIVAGGVESMSRVPVMGFHPAPHPVLVREYPQLYMAMGQTAEEVAHRYEVSREHQDAFALRSHQRAAAAIDSGRFAQEIVPVEVLRWQQADGGELRQERVPFTTDEGVRRDTSQEKLAKLAPVFRRQGTVTAGNSSQMSDGAAAVVIMAARKAAALGLAAKAVYRSFAVAGVDPDIMGVGPVYAVPLALRQAGIRRQDLGLVELNEAFAAQSLEVMRALDLDPETVNVNGGAIALGHPLGCTGARQAVTLMREAARRKVRYGLVTMCVGGGMGAAGVFEFPSA
ncbi:MAG: acetyl-CoA C-acyltransferase [Chloroflexi bacterium]|nr:acetyl-CoA C-acyltransferase [Chloroflexota bacterium]